MSTCKIAYSPIAENIEDNIDAFYIDLENAWNMCKSLEINIILGDFNAKFGNYQEGCTVGSCGQRVHNERARHVEWAKEYDMIVNNTEYFKNPKRLWMWISPVNKIRDHIDYTLINSRFQCLKIHRIYQIQTNK